MSSCNYGKCTLSNAQDYTGKEVKNISHTTVTRRPKVQIEIQKELNFAKQNLISPKNVFNIPSYCKLIKPVMCWYVVNILLHSSFITACRITITVLATAIPSVRPSVRHTPVLCQNDGT